MSQLHVAVNAALRYQVYRTETGIDRTDVGPAWTTPREASAYIRVLSEIPQVPATRSERHDLAGDRTAPRSRDDAAPSGSPEPSPLTGSGDPLNGFGF